MINDFFQTFAFLPRSRQYVFQLNFTITYALCTLEPPLSCQLSPHDVSPRRGVSPYHDVSPQFVRLTLLLVESDVTLPPAFIGDHFEFICHPWVAEFEDVDVKYIDILVEN